MAFSISASGKLDTVLAALNKLESPPTDSPDYADHCHAKQHALDFVNRCQPSSSITVSIEGSIQDGKRVVSAELTES